MFVNIHPIRFCSLVFFTVCLWLTACQPESQREAQQPSASIKKEPVNIILDTDIGPDYDDAGALAMLHALTDRGEANILATIASNKHTLVAPVIDMINTYYGRPNLPIGAPKGADGVNITSSYHWPEEITDQYPHNIRSNNQVPAATTLYRQLLAAQPDTSVTITTIGFLTNMASLLESAPDSTSAMNGVDLVSRKVKTLVAMAGKFPEGKEFNVEKDAAASAYVAMHWPTTIIFSGFEIGEKVLTGAELVSTGSPNNPVRHIYEFSLAQEKAENRMSWDQTAVLVAVRGYKDYYDLRQGRIQIREDGSNSWQDNPQGRHYYLVEKMKIPAVRDTLETLMRHEPEAQ